MEVKFPKEFDGEGLEVLLRDEPKIVFEDWKEARMFWLEVLMKLLAEHPKGKVLNTFSLGSKPLIVIVKDEDDGVYTYSVSYVPSGENGKSGEAKLELVKVFKNIKPMPDGGIPLSCLFAAMATPVEELERFLEKCGGEVREVRGYADENGETFMMKVANRNGKWVARFERVIAEENGKRRAAWGFSVKPES